MYASYAEVRNCTISNNTSTSYGGGVYLSYSLLGHSKVIHNSSNSYGGGVYVYYIVTSNQNQGITNCLIAHNTSNSYGGGIYVYSQLRLENSTVVNNQSTNYGAGIRYGSSTSSNIVNNSVIWGNRMGETASNTYNSFATYQKSAVEGGVSGSSNVIALESDNYGYESGLYYPNFVNPENDNYRLRGGSALINAGLTNNSLAELDLAGEVRVYDDTVDIGCYEFHNEEYCCLFQYLIVVMEQQ